MKEKIVCLSGTLCNRDLWNAQEKEFGEMYDFVYPSISTHTHIKDLSHYILDTIDGDFHIMGMSAGAVVAFEMLRLDMHCNTNRIKSLTVIAGNPYGVDTSKKQVFQDNTRKIKQLGIEKFMIDCVKRNATYNKSTDVGQKIINMALDVGIKDFENQNHILCSRQSAIDVIEKSCIPMAFICGDNDTICPPKMHKEMFDIAQKGNFYLCENTGHFVNLENPAALNSAIKDFHSKVKN